MLTPITARHLAIEISMAHKERDIVFFLGAGFSKSAGLPIMSEFWTESLLDYDRLRTHVPFGFEHRFAAPMLTQAAERVRTFRNNCLAHCALSANEANNIESLFSLADALRLTRSIDNKSSIRFPIDDDDLDTAIRRWIWKIYQQAPWATGNHAILKEKGGSPGVNDRFIDQALSFAPRLSIITTNYDLVVEHLVYKSRTPNRCYYHMPKTICKTMKLCNSGDEYVQVAQTRSDPTLIPTYKLHGSINFFSSGNILDKRLIIVNDAGDERTRIGRSTEYPRRDWPSIFHVDAIWKIQTQTFEYSPAFIPPTFEKRLTTPWVTQTWQGAFDQLANARSIIFIGYSLPPSDGYLRSVLQASLLERQSMSPLKVFVVDPSEATLNRFSAVFPNAHCVKATLEDLVGPKLDEILTIASA